MTASTPRATRRLGRGRGGSESPATARLDVSSRRCSRAAAAAAGALNDGARAPPGCDRGRADRTMRPSPCYVRKSEMPAPGDGSHGTVTLLAQVELMRAGPARAQTRTEAGPRCRRKREQQDCKREQQDCDVAVAGAVTDLAQARSPRTDLH